MWLDLSWSRRVDLFDMAYTLFVRDDIVAAKMTASQIAEAQKQAREWMPTE